MSPFDEFAEDLTLTALLRVFNSPQLNHPEARPHLAMLIDGRYLKDMHAKRAGSSPYWQITPKGRKVIKAFFAAPDADRRAYLSRVYGAPF